MRNESIVNKFTGKAAIVTGASSGIGFAIANMLVANDMKVYGIGRRFNEETSFEAVECDLLDTDAMIKVVESIYSKEDIRIIVNCAGVAFYGLHENVSVDSIKQMVRTNLEVPMILVSCLLNSFKSKGNCHIINVSSVTASKPAPHGAAYGATKAGLSSFSASIWEEARKHGVYVTDICPDMTESNLYRNADFDVDNDIEAKLLPSDVADSIESILAMREGTCVSSVKIMPRYNRIKKKK